jgi:thiamine-monophosphate kinase
LPLSKGVKQLFHKKTISTSLIVNGGDDYELLFTAPKRLRNRVEAIAKASDVVVTRIGHMINGSGVSLLDKTGRLINSIGTGFKHD